MADAGRKTERLKQGGQFCAAYGCHNARNKLSCKGKAFFRFPKDKPRCEKWVHNSRMDFKGLSTAQLFHRQYVFCADHFESSQFNVPEERKRLKWNAVPTLFAVPHPPPKIETQRPKKERHVQSTSSGPNPKETQLSEIQSSEMQSPGQEDLIPDVESSTTPQHKKLKSLQNRFYRLKKKHSSCSHSHDILFLLKESLPEKMYDFVSGQINLLQRKGKGRRFFDKDKKFALSLYHASPKAYRLLKKIFILPTIRTLMKTMQKVQIFPGISTKILKALKEKVSSLPEKAKECTLIIDEMSLKEDLKHDVERDLVEGLEDFGSLGRTHYVANHATVFMLKGLFHQWKQPIGYVLSSGPISGNMLRNIIETCLNEIFEVGFWPKAVIADQGSNNRRALQTLLGVTVDRPYFFHLGKKIYVFYDPPHLLKNTRNNLKKSGYEVDGSCVSWDHIVKLYNFDKKNACRIVPRLTEKHLNLPNFTKMNVKLAAQTLSHSVASGLSLLIRLGVFEKEVEETARFIECIDQLFNAFNSGCLSSSQKMGHGFSTNSGHKEFLKETLLYLKKVKCQTSKMLPCIQGWMQDINALTQLFEDLEGIYDKPFLLTDRLNQDCLENLFSVIRGKAGNVHNPSCQSFRHALRQVMVDSIFVQSSRSNCKEDFDSIPVSLASLTKELGSERNYEDDSTEVVTEESVIVNDVLNVQDWNDNEMDSVFNEIDSFDNNDNDSASDRTKMHQLFATAMPQPIEKDDVLKKAKTAVLTYISGFIGRKAMIKSCDDCKLLLKSNPTGADSELLIQLKNFNDIKGEGLFFPTKNLVNVVEQLEKVYAANIEKLLAGKRILASLNKCLKLSLKEDPLVCKNGICDLAGNVCRYFSNIRYHFTLRKISSSFKSKYSKKNRKLMNISHM